MLNDALGEELIAMRIEDLRVRQELVDSGELGGSYVPRMEAVHIRNAERLRQIVNECGGRTSKQSARMARRQRLDFGGNNLALAAGATDHILTHIVSQLAAGDLS